MRALRVNGYDMAFVERGTGAPLVLVHGTLGDLRNWEPQMQPFGERYRTFAVSLRHCWPERWDGKGDDFTVQQHASDVGAFLSALGAGPVRLLGHSRGGYIAFRTAEDHPDLISALVLVEPGGTLAPDLEEGLTPVQTLALGPLYERAAEKIRRGAVDEALRDTIDVLGGPGAWSLTPEVQKQALRDNARTLIGQVREQRAPFTRADARKITAPTLLVGGDRSPASFQHILDGLERALPDTRRVAIPEASHGSNVDNPEAFSRAVLAFLIAQDGGCEETPV